MDHRPKKQQKTKFKKTSKLTVATSIFPHKSSLEHQFRHRGHKIESTKSKKSNTQFEGENRFSPKIRIDGYTGNQNRVKKSKAKHNRNQKNTQKTVKIKSSDMSKERRNLFKGVRTRHYTATQTTYNQSPRQMKTMGSNHKDRTEARQKSTSSKRRNSGVNRVQEITKNLKRIKKRLIMKRVSNQDKKKFRKSSPSAGQRSDKESRFQTVGSPEFESREYMKTQPVKLDIEIQRKDIKVVVDTRDRKTGIHASGGPAPSRGPGSRRRVGSNGKKVNPAGRKKIGKRRPGLRGNTYYSKQRGPVTSKKSFLSQTHILFGSYPVIVIDMYLYGLVFTKFTRFINEQFSEFQRRFLDTLRN